jgi:hypothetical protein
MNSIRLFFIITLLSIINSISANIVQVTKLRGNATYLSNGMREAKSLTLNQWLAKDTSILTSDKTFLVLKYKTGSEMTLGPNSKVVVDSGINQDQQVVNLLIGKFKATVKNIQKNNENKMIIKTTGAALGIRGTEFQTSYNPETKITSLLTFHGAVAMTKIEDLHKTTGEDIVKIQDKLKENSVVVKTGEYSGISETTNAITAPVKIAPDQFTKLKLNQTLGAVEEKIDVKTFQEELKKSEEIYAVNVTSAEDSNAKGTMELRPGGLFDSNSGIYLPPPKDSDFDKKLNIYKVDEKIGKTDEVGNYLPPAGLKLDPVKGFTVDEKKSNSESVAIAKELNESVIKQVEKPEPIIIKKKKTLDKEEEDVYKKYYDPTKI